jgi:polyisoprenoid-binding protein YceI
MKLPTVIVAAVLASAPACKKREDNPPAPATAAATAPATAPGTSAPPAKTSVPPLPQLTTWQLDPENSSVTFVCKHSGFTNVRGMFQRPSGTIVLDEATPASSTINATIDVKLITTGVEERDTHLKSPDFFDAARYPTITFASTTLTRSSATSYSVTGNLTMHGTTKPVTLAVTASPPFEHFGSIRRGIEATTSVKRTDFGVGVAAWNTPGEDGTLVVADTVAITIDAELVLQPDPSKGG